MGTAAGAVPELELGLELKLGGKEGLRETFPFDAKVCGGGTVVFCFTFGHSLCFISFLSWICRKIQSKRVKLIFKEHIEYFGFLYDEYRFKNNNSVVLVERGRGTLFFGRTLTIKYKRT